jgi:hypothetical protein
LLYDKGEEKSESNSKEEESDNSEDDDEDEAEATADSKEEMRLKWTVLDPKRGPAKVRNLLKEPVITALTCQVDFKYTWYRVLSQSFDWSI